MDRYRFDMTDASSLVALLRLRALYQPNYDAYTFLVDGETQEVKLTYEALDRKARSIAAQLQQMADVGDRVLLLYPAGLDVIPAFFACLYANMVAVPAYAPARNRTDLRLQAIAEDAQPTVVLTTRAVSDHFQRHSVKNPALTVAPWLVTDQIDPSKAELWTDTTVSGQTLAYIQYTSGSTSTPKGVMISHANALANVRMMQKSGALPFGSSLFGWVPHYHDLGLVSHIIYPLYTCAPSILISPVAFIQKPIRWLQGISRYQAKASSAPNFAYELCVEQITPEQRASLDLSSLKLLLVGAEPVRYETLKQFALQFASCGFRERMFFPCYGLAEATLSVSGTMRKQDMIVTHEVDGNALALNQVISHSLKHEKVKPEPSLGKVLVSCGRPIVDQEVLIVDPDRLCKLQSSQIGEIWLKGPNIAEGYWQRREETEQTFQAYLADSGEGPFLRTGDLGFITNGELFVTGRIKDLIIIRGRNHYPQDIELTVEQSHPALQSSSSAAFSVEVENEERLVVVVEVKRTYYRAVDVDDVVEAIRQAVLGAHELQVYAILLLRPVSIPKTSSGKIQRNACRAGFLEENLNVIGRWQAPLISMPRSTRGDEPPTPSESKQTDALPSLPTSPQAEAIEAWLVSQLSDLLKIAPSDINVHDPFAHYGMDSVSAIALSGKLEEWLGRPLSATLVYDYPSIDALARHLSDIIVQNGPDAPQSTQSTSSDRIPPPRQHPPQNEMIAIIGMGCRFPGGANDPDSYWQLLRDGRDAIIEVPATRWNIENYYDPELKNYHKMNTRWGGFVDSIDQFDASFFGISRREASGMDPQQRLLLEVAWEALENAAIVPEQLAGSLTGVFIGISSGDYYKSMIGIPPRAGTGIANSIAANRISYFLDLCGPSIAIDTACSSSLVSVHLACQSLHTGGSDLALAGGVNVILSPEVTVALSQAGMMASDGHCKSFDAAADGYVRGEGTGIVVLKRLSDALADGDRILALVRGSAVNQDGRSNGLTAPTGPAQQAVIRRALEQANLAPSQIDFIEAHGSGTPLGDLIEVQSLDAVLSVGRSEAQKCALGTAKTNIGHLESASGIAGLIKAVQVLQHGQIPPHPLLKEVNPRIKLSQTPFVIPTSDSPSDIKPHFAGVSSFGFGGTNAHVVLQATLPQSKNSRTLAHQQAELERPLQILTLSAKNEVALKALASRYAVYLATHPDKSLADICFTANTGRSHFEHRLAIIANSQETARQQLQAFANGEQNDVLSNRSKQTQPKIAFLFTGQGSQYVDMGREFYESQPVFRRVINQCDEILQAAGYLKTSLLAILYPQRHGITSPALKTRLDQTAYTQPALFALEYALAQVWKSWGVVPDVVMGHSVGEYVAACVAGVFSLADGLRLVAERGRLMQALPPGGQMVALTFAQRGDYEAIIAAAIAPYADKVSIAALNGAQSVVISGEHAAVQAVIADLQAKVSFKSKALNTSHAFHSPLMEPMLAEFGRVARLVSYSAPRLNLISNLTGGQASTQGNHNQQSKLWAPEITSPHYWVRHVREPVRFADGLEALIEQGVELLIENGPKATLLGMARRHLTSESLHLRQASRVAPVTATPSEQSRTSHTYAKRAESHQSPVSSLQSPVSSYTYAKRAESEQSPISSLQSHPSFAHSAVGYLPEASRVAPVPSLQSPITPGKLHRIATRSEQSRSSPPLWLPSLRQGHSDWRTMLRSLAHLYVRGGHVDWAGFDELYQGERVSLPTYPFQRQRYWFKMQAPSPNVPANGTLHLLLGQRIDLALNKTLFNAHLSESAPSYLADHRIYQRAMLPASAYFEMALAAGFTMSGEAVSLEDVSLHENLFLLDNESKPVQLFLNPTGRGRTFEIYSQSSASSEWTLHATGKLFKRESKAPGTDLAALQTKINQPLFANTYYQQLQEQGFDYGPQLQTIAQLWQAPARREALGLLRLSEELLDDNTAYQLHPVLLNGCIQLIAAALPNEVEQGTYLPTKLERLSIVAPQLNKRDLLWAHVQVRASEAESTAQLTADLELFALDGTLVAYAEGLSLQRATRDALYHDAQRQKQLAQWLYHIQWHHVPAGTSPAPASNLAPSATADWLIFADRGGIGEQVADLLRAQGQHSLIIAAGEAYQRVEDEETIMSFDDLLDAEDEIAADYYLNPAQVTDFERLFTEIRDEHHRASMGRELVSARNVLYLWGLDEQGGVSSQVALPAALHLVQALEQSTLRAQVCLVTRGAQAVGALALDTLHVEQAPLWGLGRVIAAEMPHLQTRSLDLAPIPEKNEPQTILADLLSADSAKEREVAYRNNQRHVARLVPSLKPSSQGQGAVQVRISEYGILENLRLEPQSRRQPAAGEVTIEIYATGLNFRDVLNALGMLKTYSAELGITNASDMPFGGECAGKIVTIGEGVSNFKVGDEVIAAMAIGSLASFVTVKAHFVVHKPKNLSFVEAATIPTTFLTAYYGLHELALMQAGERVLIHAAAGGVGQAAVQLAQAEGAELFVTASPPKWEHLNAMGIETSHIMNSRTLDFAAEVMALTNGQGVDIVLNSLNGDFIEKSAEVVAEKGRFVELGKIGIWDEQKQQRERSDLSYFPFMLTEVAQKQPHLITMMFKRLMNQFKAGTIKPLPYKTFPLQDVVSAFRYMAQAKHIGKVVITHRAEASPHFGSHDIRPDSSYLITGGLGALGRQVAHWLVEQGATHLVLTGRRGAASAAATEAVDELEAAGSKVLVLKADVAKEADVARVLADIEEKMPPLRAIIHAAGVLDDGLLTQQNWSRFERVMAPKIAGAWNLHTQTAAQGRVQPLQVYFSSIASILGSPGQSNYAAANAFMDALAHHRQAMGLPTVSINWGPWAEIGMAAQTGADKRLAALGLDAITPQDGLQVLAHLLAEPELPAQVTVMPINWSKFLQPFLSRGHDIPPFFADISLAEQSAEALTDAKDKNPPSEHNLLPKLANADPFERQTLLQDYLQSEVSDVLALPKADLNMQQPLVSLGFDSLMAVELKNQIMNELELDIPIEKFIEANSLIELADSLLKQLAFGLIEFTEPEEEVFDEEEMEEFLL